MSFNPAPSPTRIGELDLHAFVDGVLRDDRRNELLAYLASHPLEAERVNAFFRQKAALAALRDQLSDGRDAAFRPDLQRALVRAVRRQRMLRQLGPIAAAILVLLPAAFAGWAVYHKPGAPLPDVAAETAPAFQTGDLELAFGDGTALIETGHIGTDGAASLAVLAQHLADRALRVPDLGMLGLRLVGGDALVDVATPAARLVYEDELGHRLLVYVGVVSRSVEQAMALVPEGHISLHLRRGPLLFAVIGPTESPRLLDVVRLVSEEIIEAAPSVPEQVVDNQGASPIKPIGLPSDGHGNTMELDVAPAAPEVGRDGHAPLPAAPVPTLEEQPKIL